MRSCATRLGGNIPDSSASGMQARFQGPVPASAGTGGFEVRPGLEMAEIKSAGKRHAFHQYLHLAEMPTLASEAGFKDVEHLTATTVTQRHLLGRSDGSSPSTQCGGVPRGDDIMMSPSHGHHQCPSPTKEQH